ncbi:MAG: hypothetical protein H6822_03285 [Planctomycetaceae bacterium]|nr:hypothetical protein [Planctomycetales bacterium]MCB9921177.1 hypothetical protein [Planctomycetaceae bacterium]
MRTELGRTIAGFDGAGLPTSRDILALRDIVLNQSAEMESHTSIEQLAQTTGATMLLDAALTPSPINARTDSAKLVLFGQPCTD